MDDTLKHIDFISAMDNILHCLISIKNLDGIYLYCNDEFAKATGFKKEEIIGKNTREVLLNRNPHLWELLHMDIDVIYQNKQVLIERQIYHAREGMRWYRIRKMPFCDESGNIVAVYSEAVDITHEQNKIKEEKERIFRMRFKLLSIKQKEALMYFADSLSHKEIAQKMNIDESTVSTYKYQIRKTMALGLDEFEIFLQEIKHLLHDSL